jgi:hypothetical protein
MSLQLLIKICNDSHHFIEIKMLGHIFWHAIDKHKKNSNSNSKFF